MNLLIKNMTDDSCFFKKKFFVLQSHAKGDAGVGIIDVDLAMIVLVVEVVVLRLGANETILPVVGYAKPQVEVEAEHAVVYLRLYIPVVKLIVRILDH